MHVSKRSYILLALTATITSSFISRADVAVVKTSGSVVDTTALTIQGRFGQNINGLAFQQNALMSFAGYQYVCWYNRDRRVCLGRRNLSKGEWEVLQFSDHYYANNDAHNTISMGICPADGTIHLSFDHHGHQLNYRVSKKGAATEPEKVRWKPELFGPILHKLRHGHSLKLTYPRFIITPDDKLQFFYRNGTTRVIHTYNPETGTWSEPRPIVAGNGYTNYHLRYGNDGRLQLMWHWRGTGHSSILPTPVGNRAKILLDSDNNAYAIYMLNKTDKWDWQIYFTHGELVIATSSARHRWTDWKVIHRESGPFLNEVQFDDTRWEADGVLSVLVQDSPDKPHDATPLRIIDFKLLY